MDVHPTKNVSIGIDPYPYIKMYLLFFHESSHVHPFSMDFPWVFISSIFCLLVFHHVQRIQVQDETLRCQYSGLAGNAQRIRGVGVS
jgi:hypothetical protein